MCTDVRSTHRHDGLIGSHHHASHPTRRQRATVTGGRRHPVAFGRQRGKGIGLGAVQDAIAIVILHDDGSRIGVMSVLHIEGRIVRTTEGTLEQHRDVCAQAARRKAVIGHHFPTHMGSSHRHDGLIGGHHHPADPTRRQAAAVTGGGWQPVALRR